MLAALGTSFALDGCRNLLCRFAGLLRLKEALPLLYERFGPAAAKLVGRGENFRLLVLFEMVQCVLCAESWVPACSSQDNASLYEEVEIESDNEPEPPVQCGGGSGHGRVSHSDGGRKEGAGRA